MFTIGDQLDEHFACHVACHIINHVAVHDLQILYASVSG